MTNLLDNKIDAIANSIIDGKYPPHYSLLGGDLGMSLFLYYYSQQKRIILEHSDLLLNRAMTLIYDNTPNPTFSSGLAGCGYLLSFLEKQFEMNVSITDEVDDYLFSCLKFYMQNKNYDFLHGALGLSFYFSTRNINTETIKRALDGTVKYLEETAEYDKTSDGLKWCSEKNGDIRYNLSLSHGMSSIIRVLNKIYDSDQTDDSYKYRIQKLITGAINYILKQEIDIEKYGSFFPNIVFENQNTTTGSRLAWCYGDLGIAITLYYAGKSLNKKEWVNQALKILLFSAVNRRNLARNYVVDAGLCHGTSGIALVYYRMWKNTNIQAFKEATDYWLNETLKMARFQDGLAGYKSWQVPSSQWINDFGLLEGIAGIGLLLLSYGYNNTPIWDECLMLS